MVTIPSEIWVLMFSFIEQEGAQLLWHDNFSDYKLLHIGNISLVCKQWAQLARLVVNRSIWVPNTINAFNLLRRCRREQNDDLDNKRGAGANLLHYADTLSPVEDTQGLENNVMLLREILEFMPNLHTIILDPDQLKLLYNEPSVWQHIRHLGLANAQHERDLNYFDGSGNFDDNFSICTSVPSNLLSLSVTDVPHALACSIHSTSKMSVLQIQDFVIIGCFDDYYHWDTASYDFLRMPHLVTASVQLQRKSFTSIEHTAVPLIKLLSKSFPRTLRRLVLTLNAPIDNVEDILRCLGQSFPRLRDFTYTGPLPIIVELLLEPLHKLRTLCILAITVPGQCGPGQFSTREALYSLIMALTVNTFLPDLVSCPSLLLQSRIPKVTTPEDEMITALLKCAAATTLTLTASRGFDNQQNLVTQLDEGMIRILPFDYTG